VRKFGIMPSVVETLIGQPIRGGIVPRQEASLQKITHGRRYRAAARAYLFESASSKYGSD
jgi:hypothetical protein